MLLLSLISQSQANIGGQVLAFTGDIPNHGPHPLSTRDEVALLGTDKEYKLFQPQNDTWRTLAEEFAEHGVGVSIFSFPQRHADLGTLGWFDTATPSIFQPINLV